MTANAYQGVLMVSTHSRPKAAGATALCWCRCCSVSTHSRPKAAGRHTFYPKQKSSCFNSQPPEGGWRSTMPYKPTLSPFQLTAARRRLVH